MAGPTRLGELYGTMPFGEAVDGGRGGNRYRAGRLRKTDNFIADLVHPWLEHVETHVERLEELRDGLAWPRRVLQGRAQLYAPEWADAVPAHQQHCAVGCIE